MAPEQVQASHRELNGNDPDSEEDFTPQSDEDEPQQDAPRFVERGEFTPTRVKTSKTQGPQKTPPNAGNPSNKVKSGERVDQKGSTPVPNPSNYKKKS